MNRKIKALLLAGMMSCVIVGAGANPITEGTSYAKADEDTAVYSIGFDIMGGKDVMPLGAWWGPDQSYYAVENGNVIERHCETKYFDYMVEAGLNMITVATDYMENPSDAEGIMNNILNLCQERNIGYFMHDSRAKSTTSVKGWMDIIQKWINHPVVIGMHVLDEPKQSKFGDIAKIYRAWNELNVTDKILYTNLYATGMGGTGLSGTSTPITIEEYYRSFIETVTPPFISSDIYPFRSPNQGSHSCINFVKDMSLLRRLSKEYKIPFWTFVASGMQHNDGGADILSELPYYQNEAETLWNINIPLAYGCKSISYFCYFQPDHFANAPNDTRDFQRNGMLGVAGNKNEWFYYIKKANMQIQAVDHILMNASSMGVIPVGQYANRMVQDAEKITSFRELTSINGEDFIIGCFDYFGKTALYVVNNSTTEKQSVTLNFSSKNNYTVIQRAITKETSGKEVTLTVEKGEGIMVVVD